MTAYKMLDDKKRIATIKKLRRCFALLVTINIAVAVSASLSYMFHYKIQNWLEGNSVYKRLSYEPAIELKEGKSLLSIKPDALAWKQHPKYQKAGDVTYSENGVAFETRTNDNDEWNYIFLDPSKFTWDDYAWHFTIRQYSIFREFAFNFRYQDHNNRYRYRFEEGRIYFDKKCQGVWFNNISSVPFPITLGRPYKVKIIAYKSLYRCYVDDELMMENVDIDIVSGSIAIILWEDDGATDMIAEVDDVVVLETIREP